MQQPLQKSNKLLVEKLTKEVQAAVQDLDLNSEKLSFVEFDQLLELLGYTKSTEVKNVEALWQHFELDIKEGSITEEALKLIIFTLNNVQAPFMFKEETQLHYKEKSDFERTYKKFAYLYRNKTQAKYFSERTSLERQREQQGEQFTSNFKANKRSAILEQKRWEKKLNESQKDSLVMININASAINKNNESAIVRPCDRTMEMLEFESKKNEKIQRMQREKQANETVNCSFKPEVNKSFKKFRSPREEPQKVFNSLYEDMKQYDSRKYKPTQQIEFEKSKADCTFKPNFFTQGFRQKVPSKFA